MLNLTSCNRDIEPSDFALPFSYGPSCYGDEIFQFSSLGDIQQQHKILYSSYLLGNEEEQILIDWEDNKGFYSLRKKDQDMDEGLIPDDTNFNPFDYTSDPILETILNSEGFVIIEDFLYLWDDGCVIHKMPYVDCDDYQKMLEFKAFLNGYTGSVIEQEELLIYRNINHIEDVDICSDSRFDFETISELNVDVDNNQVTPVANGTYCGVEVYVTHKILTHDSLNKIIRLRFDANTIQPTGSNTAYGFNLNSSVFDNVEIIDASITSTIGSTWDSLGGDSYVYSGKWFVVEVDYNSSSIPLLGVNLKGSVSTLSGDSCQDSDGIDLFLPCPISISKKPIDGLLGRWEFTIEGLDNLNGNYTIQWTFGDASPVEVVQNTSIVSHQFPTPCSAVAFLVNVTIEANGICTNIPEGVGVTSGDRCRRSQISESESVFFNGKKARMKIKVKRFSGILVASSKRVKNIFRYRVAGNKTITSTGNIYKISGSLISPTCTQEQIDTRIPADNQSGKKSFTQGFYSSSVYSVDLSNPYAVTFEHDTGFSRVLNYNDSCSE